MDSLKNLNYFKKEEGEKTAALKEEDC